MARSNKKVSMLRMVGAYCRRWRQRYGITVHCVCMALGKEYENVVYRFERGENDDLTIFLTYKALGCPIEEVIGEVMRTWQD